MAIKLRYLRQQNFKQHDQIPIIADDGVYIYSFGINPNDYQPSSLNSGTSGTVCLSRIDNEKFNNFSLFSRSRFGLYCL